MTGCTKLMIRSSEAGGQSGLKRSQVTDCYRSQISEYFQVGKGTLSPPLHSLFPEVECKALALAKRKQAGPSRLPLSPRHAKKTRPTPPPPSPARRCTNRPFFPGYSSKRTNGLMLPEKA